MCPDEEVSQTEVAEANKKAVEAHIDSSEEELEDEVNSLPECQQESNNNEEVTETSTTVDQENNSVKCVEKDEEETAKDDPVKKSELIENEPENDATLDDTSVQVTEESGDQVPECDQQAEQDENTVEIENTSEDVQVKEVTDTDHDHDEKELPVNLQEECEEPASSECKNDEIENKIEPTDQDNHIDNEAVSEPVQQHEESYPEDLNPFGDDEIQPSVESVQAIKSTNPFGSDSEDSIVENPESVVVPAAASGLTGPPPKPPRTSLNPFGSDFEDSDNDGTKEQVKVPKRKKRHAPQPPGYQSPSTSTPTPAPRVSLRPPRPPPPAPTSSYGKSQKDQANINR